MNTECTKPSVAPKPRFVCRTALKLPPSPLMSAARCPKPSVGPKPKPKVAPAQLNGHRGRGLDGGSLTYDVEVDEGHQTGEDGLNNGAVPDMLSPGRRINARVLKSPLSHVEDVSQGKEGEEEEEEREEDEEEATRKVDEDWRLSDGALTEEEVDSLWVSEGSALTAGSGGMVVEMVEADATEDMEAEEGLDAGEALADTDGLSVGSVSVDSIDENAGRCPGEKKRRARERREQEELQVNVDDTGDCTTADDLTESLTDEPPGLLIDDTDARVHLSNGEQKEEDPAPDCDVTFNILKSRCGHKVMARGGHPQNIALYDSLPEGRRRRVCDPAKGQDASGDDLVREPYYVSSEDIINRGMMPRNNKGHRLMESPILPRKLVSVNISRVPSGKHEENGRIKCVSSEDYVQVGYNGYSGHNSDENKWRAHQKRTIVESKEPKSQTVAAFLNSLSKFRLESISGPTNTDTSLSSSLSESQLLSLNDSDVFREEEEDPDGHIVPFLDDTTDTEQDMSDEHVYEEPGHSSEGENGFPFYKRTTETRSRSLSHRFNNSLTEVGVQFVQRPYMSGFGQPALSSSPMLSLASHKNTAKPHYLSLYPRSISMEAQDVPVGVYSCMEGSPRQGGAISSSGSFSRGSPLSSSGLSTPTSVSDIPPPFDLAYITKRPITKSSPSLFIEGDSAEKNKKKKSSIKRFLMLKFRRKTESKPVVDVNPSFFKASAESSHSTPNRQLELDRHSVSSSPQLSSRSTTKPHVSSPAFLLYKENKRKGGSVAFLNRSVVRVESFEDRSRMPSTPLPLTKPRSISFPNADTSDYENVPAISSDYENLQVPQQRPVRLAPFTDFFDRPSRVLSSANETDGYVDMSSLPGFKSRSQSCEQEAESAYTEAYNVCPLAVAPRTLSLGEVRGETAAAGEEDQGRTSEEEEGGAEGNYDRQPDGRSRAFYIAKELVDTERLHVKGLKLLQEDFREAVGAAVGEEGDPVLDEERLREILNELPDVYTLHRRILNELENRIRNWEESQRIADVFLTRRAEFLVFTTYIGHYDRSMSLLEDSCRASPAFAAIVHQFEQQSPAGDKVCLKHQLLQVIVRVAQYRMLLTDYLNNLSPDSKEYEDTQAAVVVVSDIADQANDSLKHGENLLRLVNIEYSVRGQRALLQPGRVFVKEGTLMKVSRKSRQPRHLFLMNDVLLYTYPQQDGKYRLKNTLPLTGLKVSKPIVENVQNALRIEATDISITLSASSFIERDDWFYTLSRTVSEHARGSVSFSGCSGEARERLRLTLGDKAPTLVPVSQVMMCMNCTSDFSLTLRRHHCHGCGRIVCRSCSRNRYPLKYMKDRMAKVCDHCYSELKTRGDDLSTLTGKGSPRPQRSSRPLSAVFQNIHPPNIWRHRKGTVTFTQVSVSEEGSISGTLQRTKKAKRSWKRLWFLLKDKVLYTYRAQEEKVAAESLPLLGFTVKLPDRREGGGGGGGADEANVFQLYHKNTLYYTFKASDNFTAQRWVNAMEEATVL